MIDYSPISQSSMNLYFFIYMINKTKFTIKFMAKISLFGCERVRENAQLSRFRM
jgi:hypothetical protein